MADSLPEGTLTVMFTDVVGSTELTNRLGDGNARLLTRQLEAIVSREVERYSGIQVKGLGDGQMLAFTSARRAIQCGVEIQRTIRKWRASDPTRAPLVVRIGLHTGEVIRDEDDLFGAAVNYASRVSAQGGPDDVIVSATTRALIGAVPDLTFEDLGKVELKGFSSEEHLFAVRWTTELGGRNGKRDSPYIGRETERGALREALALARTGRGQVVLLSGEAGIGKTRLASEIMTEARDAGWFGVLGRCYDMDVAAPYVPFQEALDHAARVVDHDALRSALGPVAAEISRIAPRLRQIFPEIGSPEELPPEQARHYLFSCVGDYLQRATAMQPTVLVLDDLHWADESTSLLIEHIGGRLDDMSLLMIGTYRDSELDVGQPFARVLDRLARLPNVQRVSLKRLPEDNVRDLLGALGGQQPPVALVSLVARESEGVPLFVQELFRHLNEEGLLFDADGHWKDEVAIGKVTVPEGVRLVIGRRIQRVSQHGRSLLTLASVIGSGFSFDLLRKLAKMEEDSMLDAIEEAERAHLLVSSSGRELRYRFSHEMVRQTLLETISAARRQRLHLGVADALEDCRPDQLEERIPELAYHLYQARERADQARVLRFTEAAGDRARRAGAFAEAEQDYRRALEFAADDSVRARILFRLALVVRAVGGSEAAIEVFREAVAAAPMAEQRWRSEVEMARSQLQLNHFDDAYETASNALQATIPARARGILLVIRAAVGAHAGKSAEGCEQDFRAGLDLLGDPIGGFSFGLTYACEWYVPEQAAKLLPMVESFRAFAPPANLHEGLRYAANAQVILGRLDEATALADEALAVATRHGDKFGQGIARTFLADLTVAKGGDIRSYLDLADERRAWLDASLPAWSHAKWRPEWLAGEWEQASVGVRRELNEGLPLARRWAAASLARILVALGDPGAAEVLAQVQRAPLPERGVPLHYTTGTWLMHAAEAMASSEIPWDWNRVLELCETICDRGVVADTAVGDIGLWHKTAGIAASRVSDWERAEKHFELAAQQAADIGHIIEQAEVRRWHGWALLSQEEAETRQRAEALLEDALHRFEALAMPGHATLVEDLLDSSKAGVP